jgi:hypothetical protein
MYSGCKGRDKEKQKDTRVNWVTGVKVEVRKNKGYDFFKTKDKDMGMN